MAIVDMGITDMGTKMKTYARASFAPLLALAMMSVGPAVNGQNTPPPPQAGPGGPVGPAPQWPHPADDITHQEIVDMNQFLDNHPEIAEQLRKDPSLIDKHQWVADHPRLREYLDAHPRVAVAFRTNPDLFMRDEERYDRQTDINHRDLEDIGRFLNAHPEIAEQLRKDPSLVDNRQWVGNHPSLQEYLKMHPQVADAFRSHPDAFMRDEERWDRDHGNQFDAANRDDRNHAELTSFGQFLGGHSAMAGELANDPALANNKEYLANHPELNEYLQTHPAMSQQLSENPEAVMSSELGQQNSGFGAKSGGSMAKPKSVPNQ